jgi:geranylgeranylglycerol-phosphate geranylgeranyltransferase
MRLREKIKGFLGLLRVGNMAVTGVSVLAGAFANRQAWPLDHVLLATASAMLIAGGGNALNDYYDLEIDKLNRPQRPLPRGAVAPAAAHLAGLVLVLAGVLLGFAAGAALGIVAAAVTALLWLYAARGKRMSIWGNLLVATVCALAFVYGGMAAGNPRLAAFPALFGLLMHFAREIVKDVQDERGDRAAKARTTAIALGRSASLKVAAVSLCLLFFATPLPFLLHVYSVRYLAAALVLVNPFLAWACWRLITNPDDARIARLSLLIKLDMVAGLAAIAAGLM